MFEKTTKRCKFCSMEIPKRAKVCPFCKKALKPRGCLAGIIIFIILGGFIAITFGTNNGIQEFLSGVSDDSEYITEDEYNQIQSGMTYDDVKQIIGSDGSLSSSVSTNGMTIEIYTWYGNGVAGSNANVTFTNGSVTGKAQVGLK